METSFTASVTALLMPHLILAPIALPALTHAPDLYPFALEGLAEGRGPVTLVTAMGLIYNEQVANDRCFVYAEFGLAPQSDPATLLQIHQTLLLRNFLDFTGKGPCFTVSPFTGKVVYIENVPLATTKADELGATLSHIATEAADWRKTYFLTGEYQLQFERVPTGVKLTGKV